jgi:hypothetical protein
VMSTKLVGSKAFHFRLTNLQAPEVALTLPAGVELGREW